VKWGLEVRDLLGLQGARILDVTHAHEVLRKHVEVFLTTCSFRILDVTHAHEELCKHGEVFLTTYIYYARDNSFPMSYFVFLSLFSEGLQRIGGAYIFLYVVTKIYHNSSPRH